MWGTPPLTVTLDLSRAAHAERPYEFVFAPQSYYLHSAGGGIKSATLAWDQALLDDLAAIQQANRDRELAKRLGGRLRDFLASTQWPVLEAKLVDAVMQRRRVVVRIRAAAAELYALPWELLTIEATGQHIGELPNVLVCYEWPDTQTVPAPDALPGGPLRLMFAWSGRVPAAEHQAAIDDACRTGSQAFSADRDVLPDASCRQLAARLEAATHAGAPVGILHLLCHGSAAGALFGLALDDDDVPGRVIVVDGAQLTRILAPHAATLRLVVLAACDSGNLGALSNQIGSVAQCLHRAGVAAVVASRFPLSTAGSNLLARTLYLGSLSSPALLEDGFLAARKQLADDAGFDWASIQLYARIDDDDGRPAVSTETLGSPQVREELMQFRALFRGARSRIALLGRYKALHDMLQDLEVPFNVVVRAQKRLLASRDAWDELRDPLDSVVMLIEATQQLLGGERLRDEFESSQRRLTEAQALLGAAIAGDTARLAGATFHIQRVLNVEISSANNRLLTTARELALGDVVDALRSVLASLARTRVTGTPVDELVRLVGTLDELHRRLEVLVREHNQWQGIDNELRLLVGNDLLNLDEARLSWAPVRTSLDDVLNTGRDAEWTRAIGGEAQRLDRELGSGLDLRSCVACVRNLWRRCNQRFVEVDKQVLQTCEDLQQVGDTLDTVIKVIG
jgi:hypothetical protein